MGVFLRNMCFDQTQLWDICQEPSAYKWIKLYTSVSRQTLFGRMKGEKIQLCLDFLVVASSQQAMHILQTPWVLYSTVSVIKDCFVHKNLHSFFQRLFDHRAKNAIWGEKLCPFYNLGKKFQTTRRRADPATTFGSHFLNKRFIGICIDDGCYY